MSPDSVSQAASAPLITITAHPSESETQICGGKGTECEESIANREGGGGGTKELIMSFKDAYVNIMIEAELSAPLPAVLFHLNQCKV